MRRLWVAACVLWTGAAGLLGTTSSAWAAGSREELIRELSRPVVRLFAESSPAARRRFEALFHSLDSDPSWDLVRRLETVPTSKLEAFRNDLDAIIGAVRERLEAGRLQDPARLLAAETLSPSRKSAQVSRPSQEVLALEAELGRAMAQQQPGRLIGDRATVQSALALGDRGALVRRGLFGVNLSGLDLRGFDLSRADLRFTSWSGTKVEGVSLRHADLRGADLTDVSWDDQTAWVGAVYDGSTRLPFGSREAARLKLRFALPSRGGVSISIERVHEPPAMSRIGYTGEVVQLLSPQSQSLSPNNFRRTGRSLEVVGTALFPKAMVSPDALRGLRVLDVGTGTGKFVEDLRGFGVDAYGVDVYLTEAQRMRPYFFEADARLIPCDEAFFDGIFSSLSVFSSTYELYFQTTDVAEMLQEALRVVKPGGFLRIAQPSSRLSELAQAIPGVTVRERPIIDGEAFAGIEIIKGAAR